jgi:FkbM family methyltransferase
MDLTGFDWGNTSEGFINQNNTEIFQESIYEKFFQVEENDIVVDLGASVGPFTYSIQNKKPKHCYTVEPLTPHINTINKNLSQFPVTIIHAAITDKKKIKISWGGYEEYPQTLSFEEFRTNYNVDKIDFLKVDCEGGEYDVFSEDNIHFLKTVPKIVTEFHLHGYVGKAKFKEFRDNILSNFTNYEVHAVCGADVKWDLWNEHFIEYYDEVIIYIDNR